MKTSITFLAGVTALLLLGATSLRANQVMVQELAFSPGTQVANVSVPYLSYSGGVYAGINHLLVGGTAMNGFCIDPFHWSSSSSLLYNVVPLNQAPKAPGTMNSFQAAEICKLWGEFYSPNMSSSVAAGMQIAIWEIVAGNQMTVIGSDYGAAAMIAGLTAYTGASADLVGLTGPGQDYVVPRTGALHVPDQASTGVLFGTALMALLAASVAERRTLRAVLGC